MEAFLEHPGSSDSAIWKLELQLLSLFASFVTSLNRSVVCSKLVRVAKMGVVVPALEVLLAPKVTVVPVQYVNLSSSE
jgi:hypothetical protein